VFGLREVENGFGGELHVEKLKESWARAKGNGACPPTGHF
jgi:hypothetical protein